MPISAQLFLAPLAVSPLDWAILALYFVVMAVIGALASRKKTDVEGYFLAGRAIPTWAVAVSIVATSLSVATFTGAPEAAYKNDLTYLSMNIGGFLAAGFVAAFFIPRLYRAKTLTIYGFIDQRLGQEARIAVSAAFLIGRLLASGVRLFMAAIPVSLLIFTSQGGDPISREKLILSICIIGAVGTAYTIFGGIRAVIWTDATQLFIVIGAVVASIIILVHLIPIPISGIVDALGRSPGVFKDGSKLRLVDFSTESGRAFTFWTALVGGTFLNMAAYGVDHDMAQRMLTAKSPLRGSMSLIWSQLIGAAVVSLFLIAGLLMWLYYNRPDIMGASFPADAAPTDTAQIYPHFLLHHLPTGLAGLAMAGMIAIAQGSLDSAINAMASSVVADLYWPLRALRGKPVDASARSKAPRVAVAGMGLVLILFAIGAAFAYDPTEKGGLLLFALGIMSYAYSGMLAVFLAALFTRRGSTASVVGALLTGIAVTAVLEKSALAWWGGALGWQFPLSEMWRMPIATIAAFCVCVIGAPRRHAPPPTSLTAVN